MLDRYPDDLRSTPALLTGFTPRFRRVHYPAAPPPPPIPAYLLPRRSAATPDSYAATRPTPDSHFAPTAATPHGVYLVRSGDWGGVTCGCRSGWRCRAKDVPGSNGMLSRFAPPGHRRPPVARARRTVCATGPRTIVDRACTAYVSRRRATNDRDRTRTAYVSRHRATNDRDRTCTAYVLRRRANDDHQLRVRGVRFAPRGHGRSVTGRAWLNLSCHGTQISVGAVTPGSVGWDR